MRCGIYSRVSTSKQEADNQLAQLREFASKMSWQIAAEYVDEVTGKHSDRPQFQRMFKDASQRKFDVLLFWGLDRLSREGALQTLQHLNRLTGTWTQDKTIRVTSLQVSKGDYRSLLSILGFLSGNGVLDTPLITTANEP